MFPLCDISNVNSMILKTQKTRCHFNRRKSNESNALGYAHVRCFSFIFKDLKRQVPDQVDIVFVFIHPDLCDPQRISLHGKAQVRHVGFVGPLDVGDLGARNYLDTASTCPDLEIKEHLVGYAAS